MQFALEFDVPLHRLNMFRIFWGLVYMFGLYGAWIYICLLEDKVNLQVDIAVDIGGASRGRALADSCALKLRAA